MGLGNNFGRTNFGKIIVANFGRGALGYGYGNQGSQD